MRALWLDRAELGLREGVDLPPPAPGEARLRVLAAGVCGTDLALLAGLYPFTGIPGHEFVGLVEIGPSSLIGQRVVCEINVACGRCDYCRGGLAKHCTRRSALGIRGRHGAFAERINVPARNLHPVPEAVPTTRAVFTEPLAAAIEACAHVDTAAHPVLVLGAGRLGQLVCRVLAARGARVVASGRDPVKLARLEGIVESTVAVGDLPRRGFDAAVDCTGSAAGVATAIDALRARGVLVVKSTCAEAVTIDTARLVVDELRIVGSRCGPFPEALEMLADDALGVESLVDAVYPLSSGLDAFRRSAERGVVKVLMSMEDAGLY